jgi:hypothetical protein
MRIHLRAEAPQTDPSVHPCGRPRGNERAMRRLTELLNPRVLAQALQAGGRRLPAKDPRREDHHAAVRVVKRDRVVGCRPLSKPRISAIRPARTVRTCQRPATPPASPAPGVPVARCCEIARCRRRGLLVSSPYAEQQPCGQRRSAAQAETTPRPPLGLTDRLLSLVMAPVASAGYGHLRFRSIKMGCRKMRGPGDSRRHDRGSWAGAFLPRG